MRRGLLLVICLLWALSDICAQDPFVTQRFNTPLFVNPALTGNADKVNRLGFLYRDQWRAVPVPYVSALINYDRKIMLGDKNRLGAGVQMFYDRAGDGALSTFNPSIFVSYTRLFNESKQAISAGAEVGFNQQSVDRSSLFFDNQYGSGGFDPSLPTGETLSGSTNFINTGFGLNFMTMMGNLSKLDLGGAVFNPHQPEAGFNAVADPAQMRFVAYAMAEIFFSPKWSITPSFHYQFQDKAMEYHASAYVSNYRQIKKMPFMWSLGGGYRVSDAAFAYAGVKMKDFLVGFSYDINSSSFTDGTNRKGGFEISLTYEFERPKKMDTIPMPIDTVEEEIVEEEIVEEIIEEEVVEEEIVVEEEVIEEEIVEEEEEVLAPVELQEVTAIKSALPFSLYFDNDRPGPASSDDYDASYQQYIKRQATYSRVIGNEEADDWFNKVTESRETLDLIAIYLESLVAQDVNVEFTFKGYASPIGNSDYNKQLSQRRIESVISYLEQYNNGSLNAAIESGKIRFITLSLGEDEVTGVNDDQSNARAAIFDPSAATERRVDIVSITVVE